MNNANEPIVPHTFYQKDTNSETGEIRVQSIGLTKREYFAAMAMQGILSNPEFFRININPSEIMKTITMAALDHADDLLLALSQTTKS